MTGVAIRRASARGTRVSLTTLVAALCLALALLASGCGDGTARNAREPKATYPVEVTAVRFPTKQAVARDTALVLVVRNAGTRTIPNVAVTLDSFYYTSTYPNLASNKRPVWIVNRGPGPVPQIPVNTEEVNSPGGAETAFVNTWALGRLAPGKSQRFVWMVTPVKSGIHTVHYTVAADLDGKARARLAGGGLVTGSLVASIAPRPPKTHVNPQTGEIAAGPNPVSAGAVGASP